MLAEWQVGQMVWSILWFTLFFMWIWLVISIFADILRSPDLGGWGKALWTIFVIFLPFFGVFLYLIARGHKMHEHAAQRAQEHDAANRAYIQSAVASSPTSADGIAKAAQLRDRGAITEEEYQAIKAEVLS
jgi:hypothetical protein